MFSDGGDCIRRMVVDTGLDETQLQDDAEVLAEGFEPLR